MLFMNKFGVVFNYTHALRDKKIPYQQTPTKESVACLELLRDMQSQRDRTGLGVDLLYGGRADKAQRPRGGQLPRHGEFDAAGHSEQPRVGVITDLRSTQH